VAGARPGGPMAGLAGGQASGRRLWGASTMNAEGRGRANDRGGPAGAWGAGAGPRSRRSRDGGEDPTRGDRGFLTGGSQQHGPGQRGPALSPYSPGPELSVRAIGDRGRRPGRQGLEVTRPGGGNSQRPGRRPGRRPANQGEPNGPAPTSAAAEGNRMILPASSWVNRRRSSAGRGRGLLCKRRASSGTVRAPT